MTSHVARLMKIIRCCFDAHFDALDKSALTGVIWDATEHCKCINYRALWCVINSIELCCVDGRRKVDKLIYIE